MAILVFTGCAKDEVIQTGSIHGLVTEADNGMPVANASVLLSPGGETCVTGSDGRYEFLNLQPGQYTVQVSKKNYESNTRHIIVEVDKTVSGDVTLNKASSKLKLSTTELNFGENWSTLSFSISNIGSSGSISWHVSTVGCSWLEVSPESGTTAKDKSSEVIVKVLRDQVTGAADAIIRVEADGESLPINVTVNKYVEQNNANRYLSIVPTFLDFGTTSDFASIYIESHNGPTSFKLYTTGNLNEWMTCSEIEGTIETYNPNDFNTVKYIDIYADREGLDAGTYSGNVIVRSDLGDYMIPVSMTVPQNGGGNDNDGGNNNGGSNNFSGTVTSIRPGLAVEITGVSRSSTGSVTVDFTVQNNEDFDINQFAPTHYWSGAGEFMAYDNLGNSYSQNNVQLIKVGNKEDSGNDFDVRMDIPQGVKVSCKLTIKNVASAATELTNISLPCIYYNQWPEVTYDQRKLVFKNLKWN